MAEGKCRKCKATKPLKYCGLCQECYDADCKAKIKKKLDRDAMKYHNTPIWAKSEVKRHAESNFWCTDHANDFRASVENGESDEHVRLKFERWLFHRKQGRLVFCELILKDGMGRPDLVVIQDGDIWIEEIVCSEKEESIARKRKKYPWPLRVVSKADFVVKGTPFFGERKTTEETIAR